MTRAVSASMRRILPNSCTGWIRWVLLMDIIDIANNRAERFIQAALSRAGSSRSPARESLARCKDCGEPIPEARRLAIPGCTRCRACQEAYENGI
jgi:phage/conjugal plasmid C-4 type zinc finger TraR family protein